MAFGTILINAESEQSLPRLLGVAEIIAARHLALVVGLAVLPPSGMPAGVPGAPDVVTYDGRQKTARADAGRLHRMFERMTAGKAFASEWRLDEAVGRNAVDALIAQSRRADLIVTSNVGEDNFGGRPFHIAERLIVETGRPVMLVPKSDVPASCGRRVLVAWNGSRESARAVFDALPLLQTAQHVKLLQVDTSEPAPVSGLSEVEVRNMLAHHGVRATSEALDLPRGTAATALISAVKAENADLLVMGGYGHWRFRELVLGGATHHVLRHMTVPVLMSH